VDINRSDIRCVPEPLSTAAENGHSPAGPSLLSGSLPQPADLRPRYVNSETSTTLPVKTHAMRIGFNYVRDLGEEGRKTIVSERDSGGAYTSFDNFLDRLRGGPIGPRAVRNLAMVGAFDGLGRPRRELLWGWQERWHGKGLRRGIQSQSELKLKAIAPSLPELDDFDVNQLEYRISDLSTGHHLIHFCRSRLEELGALESNHLPSIPSGRQVRVAGLVITRQAPSTAKKIRFFTLEDEFGQVNVTIKPDVYDRYRHPYPGAGRRAAAQAKVARLPLTARPPTSPKAYFL
jgi:error-prone DNA polymerase